MVRNKPVLAIQPSDLDEKLSNRSCDMYLCSVQAPDLGKFCGQRTRWLKVFEKEQNFLNNWKIKENWWAQRKIMHLAWARFSPSWSMSLREFKTFMNLGGPAGWACFMSGIIWLVETRYFSLGEQYYSTAGANWTRMAKQLFVRLGYRNGQCSRSNEWI